MLASTQPTVLQYLGIVCDSGTMSFTIPQEKLKKIHQLLQTALDVGGLSYRTLQRVADKCLSMTVAIRPASVWANAMFATLAAMDKAGSRRTSPRLEAHAIILGEFSSHDSLSRPRRTRDRGSGRATSSSSWTGRAMLPRLDREASPSSGHPTGL